MKLVVNENDIRLDKYIALNTTFSRSLVEKMLDGGFILVNDEVKNGSYKVNIDDEVEIDESFKMETDILPEKMNLNIVYEDNDIMIINKPSGLVVHPGNGHYSHTLVNGLMGYTKNLSTLNGTGRCGIVHRIDKDTSGLMMVAKTNKTHEILAKDFQEHNIKRTYIALLCGILPYDNATIDAPIRRDPNNFNMMCVKEEGKKAITHLSVLKRYHDYTLVSLNLETGRTHQIRVHMKYIGYPIYDDPVYGKKVDDFGQFLHSKEIEFIHPITKEKMHFSSELPKEFSEFIESLD